MYTKMTYLPTAEAQLIAARDIARVARRLKVPTLSHRKYRACGGRYTDWIKTRWTWNQALAAAGLPPARVRNIPRAALLDNLTRLARDLATDRITQRDYREHGRHSIGPLRRAFGSWTAALKAAHLDARRVVGTRPRISRLELFLNLCRTWARLGRRPKCRELCRPLSRYFGLTYCKRFGSWTKALDAFGTFLRAYLKTNSLAAYYDSDSSRLAQRHRAPRPRPLRFHLPGSFARRMAADIAQALATGLHRGRRPLPLSRSDPAVRSPAFTRQSQISIVKYEI